MKRKKSSSIRTKILAYSLLLSLIPITTISIISFFVSLRIVNNLTTDSIANQISRVNMQFDSLVSGVERLGWMVANDSVIQATLRKPLPEKNAERYSQALDMNSTLIFIKEYQINVHSFYVIGENGSLYKSGTISELDVDFKKTQWYDETMHSSTSCWFSPHVGSNVIQSIGQPMVSVGFPIIDKLSGSKLGVVIVDIEVQRFLDILDVDLMRDGKLLLTDADNNPMIYPGMATPPFSIPSQLREQHEQAAKILVKLLNAANPPHEEYTSSVNVEGTSTYLINSVPTSVNGWHLVGLIPVTALMQDSLQIALIIGASMLMICILVMLIAQRSSARIVRPLQKVCACMKTVEEGDFSTRMQVETDDEVGQVSHSFNSMLDQINLLLEKEREDQKLLRKSEYRALQAQINPHFLYNTLDSINWLARTGKVDKVCDMVDALTNFFRIGLSRGRDYITLQEELRHVQNYLYIQKMRYESKLEYIVDVPAKLYPCIIAKLVLQPLVENSIYHGIKKMRGPGKIEIGGKEDGEDVLLWVSDTGPGMTKEHLDALNDAIRNDMETTTIDTYGVVNIQKRLSIYFGSQYGLRFESEVDKGTTVYLRIPKKLEV